MKAITVRLATMIVWIALAILCGIFYGIVNDQLTVTFSPEYFSVFKRAQFSSVLEQAGLLQAPTRVQALLVGTLATWWFGGVLGVSLSIVGLAGRRRPLATRLCLRAVVGIMLFTLCFSVLFGGVAYLAEPAIKPSVEQWPFLDGIQAVRAAFAVGWWHNGAYLGGALGTVAAGIWMWTQRNLAGNV